MGSYCALRFDDLEVMSWKSHVPDFMISLFQERDRSFSASTSEDDVDKTSYRTPRDAVVRRLEIMGVTLQKARAAFIDWRDAELTMYCEWLDEGNYWAADTKAALDALTLDEWMRRAPSVLSTRYEEPYDTYIDEVDRRMKDHQDGWLFFDSCDVRHVIRLLLEACPSVEWVELDISDLITGGWLEENAAICETARATDELSHSILEPIIIMGEGGTDIQVLSLSLGALYPDVVEYFSFFDHASLSVDGGASYLAKFLRAFSAARMRSRVVAVFDNDAAGLVEYERLKEARLPKNISVIRLPDIALGRAYPTVGPQGEHVVDINGSAAGIELYLGQRNLLDSSGRLIPVRWAQYIPRLGRYHGELLEKGVAQKKFFTEIRTVSSSCVARTLYPELAAVWEEIFTVLREE